MASTSPRDGYRTWNDRRRIALHRAMTPEERLRLTIEARRAALRFAHGKRARVDLEELDELHGPGGPHP